MTKQELIQEIARLKEEKNAIVLAHYYSNPDVQDIADFLGDSCDLRCRLSYGRSAILLG